MSSAAAVEGVAVEAARWLVAVEVQRAVEVQLAVGVQAAVVTVMAALGRS